MNDRSAGLVAAIAVRIITKNGVIMRKYENFKFFG